MKTLSIATAAIEGAPQGGCIRVRDAAPARKAEADSGRRQTRGRKKRFLKVVTGGLTFNVIGKGEDRLPKGAGLDALCQPRQIQVFRTDAVNWRELALEHMVKAAVRARPLHRPQVRNRLYEAEQGRIPRPVAADFTEFPFGEVSTRFAGLNHLPGLFDGLEQLGSGIWLLNQKVQGNPLSRPKAKSWQALENLL